MNPFALTNRVSRIQAQVWSLRAQAAYGSPSTVRRVQAEIALATESHTLWCVDRLGNPAALRDAVSSAKMYASKGRALLQAQQERTPTSLLFWDTSVAGMHYVSDLRSAIAAWRGTAAIEPEFLRWYNDAHTRNTQVIERIRDLASRESIPETSQRTMVRWHLNRAPGVADHTVRWILLQIAPKAILGTLSSPDLDLPSSISRLQSP